MNPLDMLNDGLKKARSAVGNHKELLSIVELAGQKMKENSEKLDDVLDELKTAFRLIKAWVSGSYRRIPTKSIVLIVAAIMYFLNPFDVVPDFLVHVGFIDDIAVLGYVFKSLSDEISEFKVWEKDHQE